MSVSDSRRTVDAVLAPPRWACALLGIVLIVAGLFALGDLAFATIISVKFIGLTAIAAGAFEVAHAFWIREWGSFLWRIVLGALYLAFGLVLLTQPISGALILTYFLGAVLFASGVVRCVLSFAYWRQNGWMMLISGIFAVIAGVLILFGFPDISVWALGFLLGVDLISHGLAWLLYALQSLRTTETRRRKAQ
ncbi:HdeD family acid-resistance protein [Bradyrhizobium sp. 14AA]